RAGSARALGGGDTGPRDVSEAAARASTKSGTSAALERVREPLQTPTPERDDLERRLEAVQFRVCREPALRGLADAALPLRADHRERVAEAVARLRLDLAEDDLAAAADDQ